MAKFRYLTKILSDRSGASSVEYALILAMIVLVIFLSMQGIANVTITMWQNISTKSANAISGQ